MHLQKLGLSGVSVYKDYKTDSFLSRTQVYTY